jgi:hypothetical protein
MTVLIEALAVLALALAIWKLWRYRPYVFFLFPLAGFACGALYHGVNFGDWSGFTIVMGLFMGFPAGVSVMVLFLAIHYWQSKGKGQSRE